MLTNRLVCRAPRLAQQILCRNAHDLGGVPGKNIPFDITNRYKLTAFFVIFAASGFGTPFVMVRHHLTKNK